jgi:hypothetical protein
MRLASVAAFLVSASVIAEAALSGDTLVVVLQKQNGTRETHSQRIAADNCSLMLRLFKGLHEKGQSLTLNLGAPTQLMLKLFKELNEERQSLAVNLGAPTHGTAEALDHLLPQRERRSYRLAWHRADRRTGAAAYR